jgi:hypothetical protein
MTTRTALLWMTHVWDPEIEAEFEKIRKIHYPGSPDVWLILDSSTPRAAEIARWYERCHVFREHEMFQRLSYPRINKETLYNHVHFPVLDFFLFHPEYDFYWVVEFDVRYTGDWGIFLRSFESYNHDLITSHIRHFSQEPAWHWWDLFTHPTKTIRQDRCLRCFNVIFRISNRALLLIHHEQQDGWQGHPEVLIPTLLDNRGYTLLDFGGDGEFSPREYKNRFYTSGSTRDGVTNPFCTLRWKPSRARAGFRKNKLYHPVKPVPMMEPLHWRLRFFARWLFKYFYENIQNNNR